MKNDYEIIFDDDTICTSARDCACPDTFSLNTPSILVRNGLFYAPKTNFSLKLTADYWLINSIFSVNGPCLLNSLGWQRYQDFLDKPTPLQNTFDEKLLSQKLIIPEGYEHGHYASTPVSMTAWLHVTNACNLECAYCYVRKTSERMSHTTGINAIDYLVDQAKKNHLKSLKVKFAGGEATLHYKLVQVLHEYAKMLCDKNGLAYQAVMLTNGFFINEKFADWLATSDIKVAVSIDGLDQIHDLQRPQKNGKGSFSAIEKTVDQVLASRKVFPNITVTITKQNASHIDKIINWITERDLRFSLNFYRENNFSSSKIDLQIEEATIISGIRKAYKALESKMPTWSFLDGLLDRIQSQSHLHTCGVGKNYVVVTHTGAIAQCHMHLDIPVSSINTSSDLFETLTNGPIQNLSVNEKEGCKNCSFKYQCTGGCPVETFRSTGRWDVKSPHCNIYKTLYPEALRLEGLRLLNKIEQ